MAVALEGKLQGFSLLAQEKLEAIICSIPGKKDLIIESSLIKPLDYICSASWLKLKGIRRIHKFNKINAIKRSTAECVQVYMLRSDLMTLHIVLQQIRTLCNEYTPHWPTDDNFKYFHVIWLPSCFAYFQQLLEVEGLYGLIEFHQFNWNFIYLDKSILSCEIRNVFATTFAKGDCSLLPSIMHSIRILYFLCGQPDLIITYGKHSENIMKMLQQLPNLPRTANQSDADSENDIDVMVIIDRDKDYVSPLLTPAVYAGLLLEIFPFNAGVLDLNSAANKAVQQKLPIFANNGKMDKNENAEKSNRIRHMFLNAIHDEIYAANCYKPFVLASADIRDKAKSFSLETKKVNSMKVQEMHEYVSRRLPKLANLKDKLLHHLNACEQIIIAIGPTYRQIQTLEKHILNNDIARKQLLNGIEILLATESARYSALRLLCLFHVCIGLTDDELMQFINDYTNYFGFQHLLAFHYLANAGLLPQIVNTKLSFNQKATKLLSNIPLNIPKFQQHIPFQTVANRLKLLKAANDDNPETLENSSNSNSNSNKNPATDDSSSSPNYVFNGLYVPLVAQLCVLLLKSTNTEELMTKLPFNDSMKFNDLPIRSYAQAIKQADCKELLPLKRRRLCVYMVGSVTYAEIAACQLVAERYDADIHVTSDAIVSGTDLIASAF